VYEADCQLVARMRAREQRAFEEFFAVCAPRLTAFAARRSGLDFSSLEDIVQNTLIKAMRNLESYRGDAALLTWVTEICRHELADVHRNAARRPVHESLDSIELTSAAVLQLRLPEPKEPPGELEVNLRRAAILRVLDGLPKQYALALEAKYGDGLSVDDIAKLLDVTPIAAQSLLARAREAFRNAWRAQTDGVTPADRRDEPQ
jgi:RNA polymerase sigma-70 factor, ECF subfamily